MQCAALQKPDCATDSGHLHRLLYIGAGMLEERAEDGIQFSVASDQLSLAILRAADPDLVIFPLIGADHDAVAVLQTLLTLGYRGICLVLSPALPNPRAVEAELRSIGQGLQVRLQISA